MDIESFSSNKVSSKSIGILFEICTRNDILQMNEMLAQAKKYLKNENAKGSNALAELIKELTESRNAKLNIVLNVALEAEKTPDLINVIRQLLSTPSMKNGERGLFVPEIFGTGKIGWSDSTYQLIIKNAKDFLQQISNGPSSMEIYRLQPLISVGMEVPDIPSARFSHIDIDNVFYLNSGSLVFKANIDWGKKNLSGLFSINNTGLKTIITQNGIISTPFTEHLFKGLKIQFLSLLAITGNTIDFWYDKSNSLLYLNIKIESGWMSGYSGLYCWDGECLKKFLTRGDEIHIDDQTYIIQSASVNSTSHEGYIIICYKSLMPKIIIGLAIYKNDKFEPLYKNQDIIGDRNVRINLRSTLSGEFGLFKEYADWFSGGNGPGQISNTIIFDDRIVCLTGERTWDDEGDLSIIKLPEKKVEKIIGIKDDYPITPKSHYISKIYSLKALNQEKILISLLTMPKSVWKGDALPQSHIILYDKGNYVQLSTIDFPLSFSIKHVKILPDEESILYNCSTWNAMGGGGETFLFLLHKKMITNLLHGFNVSSIDNLKFISYPLNGAIIQGKKSIYKKDLGNVSEDEFSYWFLAFDQLGKGLRPVPEINISSEQSIPLNDILVWKNKKEAIIVKKEGIFLLIDEYAES